MQRTETLSSTKAPGFAHRHAGGELSEFRLCERRFFDVGKRPSSTWQLLGAGSVGSQSLVGIPVLHHLRHHPILVDRVRIWPFETGLTSTPTRGRDDAIVFAEIWPSALVDDVSLHEIKDARQVMGTARHLAAADRRGELAALFDPVLGDAERNVVCSEEGWILDAPPPMELPRNDPPPTVSP